MKKKSLPKPRNPYVSHMLNRKSGSHEKSKKSIRRDSKMKIKKELRDYSKVNQIFVQSLISL